MHRDRDLAHSLATFVTTLFCVTYKNNGVRQIELDTEALRFYYCFVVTYQLIEMGVAQHETAFKFSRYFDSAGRSLACSTTLSPDDIKADYQNGVLTLVVPKREEAKPKQIKVSVGTPAAAK
jgi:hypothetical protein